MQQTMQQQAAVRFAASVSYRCNHPGHDGHRRGAVTASCTLKLYACAEIPSSSGTSPRRLAPSDRLLAMAEAPAVIGCLFIGFHDRLSQALGVPVIDPYIAALKRAEYAAELKRRCGWKPSRT